MNALAHHEVGKGHTCGQYFHPHFTVLWLRTLFFNQPKGIRPAVVSDDDACVFDRSLPWGNEAASAENTLRRLFPPGVFSTVRIEGKNGPNDEKQNSERLHSRGILSSLKGGDRSGHSDQPDEKTHPPHERDQDGPLSRPMVVATDNRQAGDKE